MSEDEPPELTELRSGRSPEERLVILLLIVAGFLVVVWFFWGSFCTFIPIAPQC
ncbi:MAG: hypothetical protein SVG88_05575 [Halobacteriales archaeon]|nr:hypothetical protein [Halobacteriales archaeon]